MTETNEAAICNTSHHKIIKLATIITGLNCIILILLAVWFSWSIIKYYDNIDDSSSLTTTTLALQTTTKHHTFNVITRDEWRAVNPTNLLQSPVNRVIILHTATETCSNQTACGNIIRSIQTNHMKTLKFDDIGVNFLIGGDGAAYEGRGWTKQGAHTKGYNVGSIGVALIGTFKTNLPTQIQFDALKLLLDEGIRLNKLTEDYKMYPHPVLYDAKNLNGTVISVIKDWPHFEGSLNK